jgi:hypothetical protein
MIVIMVSLLNQCSNQMQSIKPSIIGLDVHKTPIRFHSIKGFPKNDFHK